MLYYTQSKKEREVHTMTKKSKLDKMIKINRKKSMSKKKLAEYNKAQRNTVSMNTGTRVHKGAKDYDRQREKQATRKAMQETY